jgi:hypothetical protein
MSGAARLLGLLLALLILPGPSTPAAEEKEAPEAEPVVPGVDLSELGGARLTDARLSERVLGLVLPRGAGEGREVLLLTGPLPSPEEKGERKTEGEIERERRPRHLRRLNLVTGVLEPLRDDLAGVRRVESIDLEGDGREELLLVERKGFRLLRPGPERRWEGDPESLLAGEDLGRIDSGVPRMLFVEDVAPTDPFLLSLPGSLRAYGRGAEGGFERLVEIPVPQQPSWRSDHLRLTTPPVTSLGRGEDGELVLATRVEAVSPERLRTRLIDLDAPEGARSTECWMALPAPEDLLGGRLLLLDGRPAAAVTSTPASKLGLFDEKKLRVYLLGADRTRTGREPIFALETRINLWQAARIQAHDLNRDGHEDLVLGYWKGLKNDRVVLDVYLADGEGGFRRSPGTTAFEMEGGDRSVLRFGHDLDRDGRPDLLLRSGKGLTVHAGREPGGKGRGLVEERPLWTIPLPEGIPGGSASSSFGTGGIRSWTSSRIWGPYLVDLDGDGREEVLMVWNEREPRRGRVIVVRLPEVETGG